MERWINIFQISFKIVFFLKKHSLRRYYLYHNLQWSPPSFSLGRGTLVVASLALISQNTEFIDLDVCKYEHLFPPEASHISRWRGPREILLVECKHIFASAYIQDNELCIISYTHWQFIAAWRKRTRLLLFSIWRWNSSSSYQNQRESDWRELSGIMPTCMYPLPGIICIFYS